MPSGFRGRFLIDSNNSQGTLLVAPSTYTSVAVTPNQRRRPRCSTHYPCQEWGPRHRECRAGRIDRLAISRGLRTGHAFALCVLADDGLQRGQCAQHLDVPAHVGAADERPGLSISGMAPNRCGPARIRDKDTWTSCPWQSRRKTTGVSLSTATASSPTPTARTRAELQQPERRGDGRGFYKWSEPCHRRVCRLPRPAGAV